MGFDARVSAAMRSLGYSIFPFEAFDKNGELKVPDSVRFPADVSTELGRIASNPLWAELYRTMSPLQGHHRCFMAGIGFMNDRLQVAVVKSATTVANPNEAQNWADSYHGTVESTLHAYSGRSYLVDQRWWPAIEKARGMLPPSQRDVEGVSASSYFFLPDDDRPAAGDGSKAVSLMPWLSFGLDLLAELVTKVTVRTKVLTTVIWYPPEGVHADQTYASRWRPIHTDLQAGWLSGHRSAHLIWNPRDLPVTWQGAGVQWKGPGLDMPHWPHQWCQALRPLANCTGRPVEGAESGVVAVEE